jgi:hypothetical protein
VNGKSKRAFFQLSWDSYPAHDVTPNDLDVKKIEEDSSAGLTPQAEPISLNLPLRDSDQNDAFLRALCELERSGRETALILK